MEMVFNNGFCEMSQEDMMVVDGGIGIWGKVLTITLGSVCIAWAAPAALIVGTTVGVAAGISTGLTAVGTGVIGLGIGINH